MPCGPPLGTSPTDGEARNRQSAPRAWTLWLPRRARRLIDLADRVDDRHRDEHGRRRGDPTISVSGLAAPVEVECGRLLRTGGGREHRASSPRSTAKRLDRRTDPRPAALSRRRRRTSMTDGHENARTERSVRQARGDPTTAPRGAGSVGGCSGGGASAARTWRSTATATTAGKPLPP